MASARDLANRSCGLRDGSLAGQWRLPNKVEWEALIDKDASNPALPTSYPFTFVHSHDYWSSTTYAPNANFAWLVNLNVGYVDAVGKTDILYVWPVRYGR